jgi:hypothetical protein
MPLVELRLLHPPSIAPTVQELRGGAAGSVLDAGQKAKPEAAARLDTDRCGLTRSIAKPEVELAKLHYVSVLTAGVVHKLLSKQPEHCAAELEPALLIRNVKRLDAKK